MYLPQLSWYSHTILVLLTMNVTMSLITMAFWKLVTRLLMMKNQSSCTTSTCTQSLCYKNSYITLQQWFTSIILSSNRNDQTACTRWGGYWVNICGKRAADRNDNVCSSKTYQQVRNLQFHFWKANGKIDHFLILLEDHLLVLVIVDVGVVLWNCQVCAELILVHKKLLV